MSSWTKTDTAVALCSNYVERAHVVNRTSLYQNASVTFISGHTHGLFNYTTSETQSGQIEYTGWVLKTTGSGGSR